MVVKALLLALHVKSETLCIVGSAHVLYIYLQGNDGDGAAMHRQCGVDDRISVILRLSSNISMSVFESIKISWGNEKLASVGGFCFHFS